MNGRMPNELRFLFISVAGVGLFSVVLRLWPQPYNLWAGTGVVLCIVAGAAFELHSIYPDRKRLIVGSATVVGVAVALVLIATTNWLNGKTKHGATATVTLRNRDGKVGDLILPQYAGVPAGLVVYFHNSGLGSAFHFNAGFLGSKTAPFTHMTRSRNRKDGSISNEGRQDATIGADSDYSITEQLPAEWAAHAVQPNNGFHFIPGGMYEYCDESGNYTCKSFMLWIQGRHLIALTR
jgi:hypothetical protein